MAAMSLLRRPAGPLARAFTSNLHARAREPGCCGKCHHLEGCTSEARCATAIDGDRNGRPKRDHVDGLAHDGHVGEDV